MKAITKTIIITKKINYIKNIQFWYHLVKRHSQSVFNRNPKTIHPMQAKVITLVNQSKSHT
jgi:hypothetical protein